MTRDAWRKLVEYAAHRSEIGDGAHINRLVELLHEQDCAKAALGAMGFGVTGTPWQEIVAEIGRLATRTRDNVAHQPHVDK